MNIMNIIKNIEKKVILIIETLEKVYLKILIIKLKKLNLHIKKAINQVFQVVQENISVEPKRFETRNDFLIV